MKLFGWCNNSAFLKAYKPRKTKKKFPYERFQNPDELDFPQLPPYKAFFSKLGKNNPLDKDCIDFKKLRKKGLDKEQALKSFKSRLW